MKARLYYTQQIKQIFYSSSYFQESYGEMFPRDFQKKYASVVLELERINKVTKKTLMIKF